MRAWYMDNNISDQREENHRIPQKFISLKELYNISGVEYYKVNIDSYSSDELLEDLKKERGYTYEDEITCSKDCLQNYEEKLKSFFREHLHTDEEIRLVIDGSGYFDVRDRNDEWVRIEVVAGDLIIIPSGIYHRFTLDTKNYIRAKRLFIGEPKWTPYNRPVEDMDCRKEYIRKLENGEFNIVQ